MLVHTVQHSLENGEECPRHDLAGTLAIVSEELSRSFEKARALADLQAIMRAIPVLYALASWCASLDGGTGGEF